MLSEYRMQHRPAGPEYGAPLYNLTADGFYPEDVYGPDAVRMYGQGGGRQYSGMDQEIYDLITAARNNPNQMVKIYRSVPADAEPVIHPGDWVTPSRRYAELHSQGVVSPGWDAQIVEMEVPASSLYTNADSWAEWGYWPS